MFVHLSEWGSGEDLGGETIIRIFGMKTIYFQLKKYF